MRPRIKKLLNASNIENSLGYVMLVGALFSAFVVLLGGGLYLWRYGNVPVNYRVFQGAPPELCAMRGCLRACFDVRHPGPGIIQTGLLLLVAVQVVRIVLTGLLFLLGRDWFFVLVTTVVLGILLYSLFVQ